MQASRCAGSMGHGAFLWLQLSRALAPIRKPEVPKTRDLFSLIQINCGTFEISPVNAAPMPIETRRAGNAQQINVLKEENKPSQLTKVDLLLLNDCITGLLQYFFNLVVLNLFSFFEVERERFFL